MTWEHEWESDVDNEFKIVDRLHTSGNAHQRSWQGLLMLISYLCVERLTGMVRALPFVKSGVGQHQKTNTRQYLSR